MKFNTKVIHGGQHHDPSTGAVMPPVYQTSTFVQTSPGQPINPDLNTVGLRILPEARLKTPWQVSKTELEDWLFHQD